MANPAPPGKLKAQIGKSIDEDEQLFFMHIPKTAGTSLIAVLDQRYTVDEICPLDRGTTQKYLSFSEAQRNNYKFIRGHFPYSLVNHIAKPRTLTFLRDPVKRTLSAINHHKRLEKQGLSFFKEYSLENMTVEDFLDNHELGNFICNKAVQYLNDITTRVPGGTPVIDLPKAKERLNTFDFVGFTEKFNESLSLLSYTFKLHPINTYQALQVAPEGGNKEIPSRQVMDRLAEMNRAEIELYDYGLKLFNERISNMAESQSTSQKTQPASRISAVEYNFRRVDPGRGWHVGELHPTEGVCRWSGPELVSYLNLPLAYDRDLMLEFQVINSITQGILDSLVVEINGHPINMTKIDGTLKGSAIFKGLLPKNVLSRSDTLTTIAFKVSQTHAPRDIFPNNDDERKLGLCYNWLRIFPCE